MNQIPGSALRPIIDHIGHIIGAACKASGNPEKKGGYLCIADHNGNVQLLMLVGEIEDSAKAEKYRQLVQEKCQRLAANPEHVSVAQSADGTVGKPAGAIRGLSSLYGFSGLPPLLDEASMLATALAAGDIDPVTIQEVIKVTNNPFAKDMLPESVFRQPSLL